MIFKKKKNLKNKPILYIYIYLKNLYQLNLQHYSMGDQMGLLLAESISGLPFIQSINISDNKLTDVSLGPILTSIMSINNLLNLDLSENITGPIFAKLLAEYLAKPSCSLIKLTLKNAGYSINMNINMFKQYSLLYLTEFL